MQKINIPHSVELEESVLGAMLVDAKAPLEAMTILKTDEIFFKLEHRLIFRAIESLYLENEPIDMLTVSVRLSKLGNLERAGGDYVIAMMASKISSGSHVEYHCRVLVQYWIKRQLILKADKIKAAAFDATSDCFDVLQMDAKMNDDINELVFTAAQDVSYPEALDQVVKRVELISSQSEKQITGVPTGFKKIDEFTGGWQPGELIIVAARPGMGKTALALKNAVDAAQKGYPVGFFSLEMSTQQLAARTVAIESNFHLAQLLRDGFAKDKYFQALMSHTDRMKSYPIFIDDQPGKDIRDIIAKARIWKRKYDIKIIFIDYLQLASDRSISHREQEIAQISRSLKALAKELSVPVIALSQLSRAVETRVNKRPKLSDLRESGAIEQDADIVTFIYRDEYYNPGGELPDYMPIGTNTEFSFAKYRHGSLETKAIYFDANKVKFVDSVSEEVESENDNPF